MNMNLLFLLPLLLLSSTAHAVSIRCDSRYPLAPLVLQQNEELYHLTDFRFDQGGLGLSVLTCSFFLEKLREDPRYGSAINNLEHSRRLSSDMSLNPIKLTHSSSSVFYEHCLNSSSCSLPLSVRLEWFIRTLDYHWVVPSSLYKENFVQNKSQRYQLPVYSKTNSDSAAVKDLKVEKFWWTPVNTLTSAIEDKLKSHQELSTGVVATLSLQESELDQLEVLAEKYLTGDLFVIFDLPTLLESNDWHFINDRSWKKIKLIPWNPASGKIGNFHLKGASFYSENKNSWTGIFSTTNLSEHRSSLIVDLGFNFNHPEVSADLAKVLVKVGQDACLDRTSRQKILTARFGDNTFEFDHLQSLFNQDCNALYFPEKIISHSPSQYFFKATPEIVHQFLNTTTLASFHQMSSEWKNALQKRNIAFHVGSEDAEKKHNGLEAHNKFMIMNNEKSIALFSGNLTETATLDSMEYVFQTQDLGVITTYQNYYASFEPNTATRTPASSEQITKMITIWVTSKDQSVQFKKLGFKALRKDRWDWLIGPGQALKEANSLNLFNIINKNKEIIKSIDDT